MPAYSYRNLFYIFHCSKISYKTHASILMAFIEGFTEATVSHLSPVITIIETLTLFCFVLHSFLS